jgi:hypothetical protein
MMTLVLLGPLLATSAALQTPPAALSQNGATVSSQDLQVARRAAAILDAPTKWDRHDTQTCAENATTFSMYCALERASRDLTGTFHDHDGPLMREARGVIDFVAARTYSSRLTDYNNDLTTTFADLQAVFRIVENRIARQLAPPQQAQPERSSSRDQSPQSLARAPTVDSHNTRIVARAQQILASAEQWNRADTGDCPAGAQTFSLRCALRTASSELISDFQGGGPVIDEARQIIDFVAAKKYDARLNDYNNDPATTFADIQAFLRILHNRFAREVPALPTDWPQAPRSNQLTTRHVVRSAPP